MRRLPLADQFPYEFYPPKVHRLWLALGYPAIRRKLRREQLVMSVEIQGLEFLKPLPGRGDGVLIAPNHSDNADGGVMFEVARRAGRPFCYMAAYQLFDGLNRFILPRLGAFPVDREGADLKAFKAGVELLSAGAHPLVVFPEGEVYHTADRLTPLREGAAALAVTAARRISETGKSIWIVPVAIKYRFLDGHDPLPALLRLMDVLESRFTWWPQTHRDLVDRIYFYAEGMLALKELEYGAGVGRGLVKERIARLRSLILDRIENQRLGKRSAEPVPVRVKVLRRTCLDALTSPQTTPEDAHSLRRDLNDLFVVVQLYSYPGDYVNECPTMERAAETLMKFEQDIFGVTDLIRPRTPRRALVRLGEPINVTAHLKSAERPRVATATLTTDLEHRMQALLDAIGPGRPIEVRRDLSRPS
ncbi:MAG: lysophospholipid acyltransferase family protein [Isosphaeraceae bacterium]